MSHLDNKIKRLEREIENLNEIISKQLDKQVIPLLNLPWIKGLMDRRNEKMLLIEKYKKSLRR